MPLLTASLNLGMRIELCSRDGLEVRRTLKTSVDKALATKNSEARRGSVTGRSANAGYRLVRLLVVFATVRGRRSTLALRNSTFLVGHSSVPARIVVHDPNRWTTTRPQAHGYHHRPCRAGSKLPLESRASITGCQTARSKPHDLHAGGLNQVVISKWFQSRTTPLVGSIAGDGVRDLTRFCWRRQRSRRNTVRSFSKRIRSGRNSRSTAWLN